MVPGSPLMPGVSLPPWLFDAAGTLIDVAEKLIGGEKAGANRKRWVVASLRKLLREHDLPGVPDWLEHAAEELIVDVLVEAAFVALRRKGA
jgi:hypothetical protein